MAALSTSEEEERRKSRKPEQPIYVPRPKAQALAEGADEPPWERDPRGGGGGGGAGKSSWEHKTWDRKHDVPEWRKQSNKEQVFFICNVWCYD
jgi:hypothetical protein